MREHEIRTKFWVDLGRPTEMLLGVKKQTRENIEANDRCKGCCFSRMNYDYSCGYGFLRHDCLLGGCAVGKCNPAHRNDGENIIYVRLNPSADDLKNKH